MSVRMRVQRDFAAGRLDGDSSLKDVPYVGSYIFSRVRRALNMQGDVDVSTFQRRLRQRTVENRRKFLLLALQNRRANQCVRASPRSANASFHAPDVNRAAYEALVAVLDADRPSQLAPRMPRRSVVSKTCACRATCDGACVRTADGACVPRNGRTGFVGAGHPDQIVRAESDADASRVRNAARTRRSPRAMRDPDTLNDFRRNPTGRTRYSRRGRFLFRVAGPRVRTPL